MRLLNERVVIVESASTPSDQGIVREVYNYHDSIKNRVTKRVRIEMSDKSHRDIEARFVRIAGD